ncbi:hypothetical protein HYH03_014572 [Edaphochlamys debaryana]|uniref:Uncharacterized protein n=1 Tax=Edaphochlamys debaryana TaxID=47281 RepID=A0A835XPU7_9CHLO|nr:hypothetical protein HYH03_014572 [Edaphochlamys debaryana]|eukprot:KAG2486773.1 hypothetical protein HYH03_014572 [Edaphochlamys debaryana]
MNKLALLLLLGVAAQGGLAVSDAAAGEALSASLEEGDAEESVPGVEMPLVKGRSYVSGDPVDASSKPLGVEDLVIIVPTFVSRLPLVHATRPARRGVRTFIVVENGTEAARLNEMYGGLTGPHNESYISWANSDGAGSFMGGVYGSDPIKITHPLHVLGPRHAMAPVMAHEVLVKLAAAAAASAAGGAAASSPPPPPAGKKSRGPPLPYKWMLVARDDTLWIPSAAVKLLSPFNAGAAVAASDHLVDFNGIKIMSPSRAPATCLPCHYNLTDLMGRRKPPRVPQPACPVCRPAKGCEFRFDLCMGLAGGPVCGTKRFLGAVDRCHFSWPAGGAGLAMSAALLHYLDKERWVGCVRDTQPTTGERAIGRCMWRSGVIISHVAAGMANRLTRDPFADRFVIFGNPLARPMVFGPKVEEVMGPAYAAQLEATKTASVALAEAAKKAAVDREAAVKAGRALPQTLRPGAHYIPGDSPTLDEIMGPPPSTRTRRADAPEPCDAQCMAFLESSSVSVHLDLPYEATAEQAKAAAELMEAAAKKVSAAPGA